MNLDTGLEQHLLSTRFSNLQRLSARRAKTRYTAKIRCKRADFGSKRRGRDSNPRQTNQA